MKAFLPIFFYFSDLGMQRAGMLLVDCVVST